MTEPTLIFNGIDAETGGYLLPPMTEEQLLDALRRKPRAEEGVRPRGFEGDARDLAEAGWGVIFPEGADPAVHEALGELLGRRKVQAGASDPRRYKELTYHPGESRSDFLQRHRVSRGPVRPKEMPYYLLLMGGPDEIPYDFQFQLDVTYAVGRLAFDTPEDYARYSASVVGAETGDLSPRPRRAALFGAHNPDDGATGLSSRYLVEPLARSLEEEAAPGWRVDTWLEEEATKTRLAALLGDEAPALLFTASHGMGFRAGNPKQAEHQGALLCQDWPGPKRWRGGVPEDFYFAAADVSERARLAGMIAFFFACYGAGTPELDSFAHRDGSGALDVVEAKRLAPRALVSKLPQRLLSLPRGGALAAIGHVDRAWAYSFLQGSEAQLGVFEATFERLLAGHPVGSAMKYFGQHYGQLAADLMGMLQRAKIGNEVDPVEVAKLWTAHNDARSYAVLGDPAVRLAVEEDGQGRQPD